MGMHVPGPQRKNKFASWHACGLRLSYTAKNGYTGESRSIGADPQHVAAAQEELKMVYSMNETIFTGKLMEIRGLDWFRAEELVEPRWRSRPTRRRANG